jgi:hypothetical protein
MERFLSQSRGINRLVNERENATGKHIWPRGFPSGEGYMIVATGQLSVQNNEVPGMFAGTSSGMHARCLPVGVP